MPFIPTIVAPNREGTLRLDMVVGQAVETKAHQLRRNRPGHPGWRAAAPSSTTLDRVETILIRRRESACRMRGRRAVEVDRWSWKRSARRRHEALRSAATSTVTPPTPTATPLRHIFTFPRRRRWQPGIGLRLGVREAKPIDEALVEATAMEEPGRARTQGTRRGELLLRLIRPRTAGGGAVFHWREEVDGGTRGVADGR